MRKEQADNLRRRVFIFRLSDTALRLEGKIMEAAKEMQIEEYRTIRKSPDGDEWKLLDFGSIVVHLMSPTARKFYDLERLWYDSPNLLV